MSGVGSDPFSLDEDIGGEGPPAFTPHTKPAPSLPVVTTKPAAPPPRKTGKRGRPRLDNPKKQITLRLDADLIAHYRKTGRGWQTRINEALREASGLAETGR